MLCFVSELYQIGLNPIDRQERRALAKQQQRHRDLLLPSPLMIA
jgi:hypothetical protein